YCGTACSPPSTSGRFAARCARSPWASAPFVWERVLRWTLNTESAANLSTWTGRGESQFPDLLVPALDPVLELDALTSKECEINLRAESVDADGFHSHGVAEAKFAAVSASFNDVFLLVIVIVVVR